MRGSVTNDDESPEVVVVVVEDEKEEHFSSRSSVCWAGVVFAFFGLRPLLLAGRVPGAVATGGTFLFNLPLDGADFRSVVAGAAGAIAAGFGAIGRYFSSIRPTRHATSDSPPYIAIVQHPPLLSIILFFSFSFSFS
jgi:hypothetical protein